MLLHLAFLASVFSFDVVVDPGRPPYINIVMPAWNEPRISGGPKTVYILGVCLKRAGFNVRFVDDAGVGRLQNSTIEAWEAGSSDLTGLRDMHWHDFSTGAIPVSPNDLFMATWCHSKRKTDEMQSATNSSKIPLYIVQDDEQWLCGGEAVRGYGIEHFAIFNGPPLAYWFQTAHMGVYDGKYDPDSHSHIALAALRAGAFPTNARLEELRRPVTKKRLGVYYRQHSPRNMYTTIEQMIRRGVLENLLPVSEWDFVGISDHGPFPVCGDQITAPPGDGRTLPSSVCLQVQPYMRAQDYDDYLHTIDVAISLCSSGGASWPIMDFALHGAVTVTNGVSAAHEEFFRGLSPLILVSNTTEFTSLYAQFELAVERNRDLTPADRSIAMWRMTVKFPDSFCSEGCFGESLYRKIRYLQTGETVPIERPPQPQAKPRDTAEDYNSWIFLVIPFAVVAVVVCIWLRPVPTVSLRR
jgi:hypothetical protein